MQKAREAVAYLCTSISFDHKAYVNQYITVNVLIYQSKVE